MLGWPRDLAWLASDRNAYSVSLALWNGCTIGWSACLHLWLGCIVWLGPYLHGRRSPWSSTSSGWCQQGALCAGARRWPAIVETVHTCPKGFASYCTISNTVKAIGIGGSASLFASVKMSNFLASSQEAEARNLVALTRGKGLCLLLLPSTHEHTESPLHTIRTMCALRHGLFHIGKDRVELDAFAAFLTQPDTVDFANDGVTIDSSAPFSLDSWLFTHQISYFGKWDYLPLALRLTFRTTPFELTLALRQEVPRANAFLATPDLFYWQGHLLDGIRVTLNFGVNCLELASEHFIYARFGYPKPGLTPPLLEDNGWTVTPECGSYFFSRASLSLGHMHPSRSASPVTRSRVAHLPMHGNQAAPPSFLPPSAIPPFYVGLARLCESEVLQDPLLNHSAWPHLPPSLALT